MKQIRPQIIDTRDGEDLILYSLPISDNPERDSVLLFSLPKAGTILLNTLAKELVHNVGLRNVNVAAELFKFGIWSEDDFPPSVSDVFLSKGYCYGGITSFPNEYKISIFGKVKSILLVRDPRDMLVSSYYSVRYSHPEPGTANGNKMKMPGREAVQKVEIDEYVINMMRWYQSKMMKYKQVMQTNTLRLFRYEDVIYDKEKWVKDICEHFDWDIPINIQRQIVAKNDIIPSHEDKMKHVRQVHPGNYKKKLKVETIRKLEETFAEEMAFFWL